MADSGQKE